MIQIKACPSSYILSRDNLDLIIQYLKTQENDHELRSLIRSLEDSLKNKDSPETTVTVSVFENIFNNYHGISTHQHTLALKAGSNKWESAEHIDGEVEVILPDIEKTYFMEQQEIEFRKRKIEEQEGLRRRYIGLVIGGLKISMSIFHYVLSIPVFLSSEAARHIGLNAVGTTNRADPSSKFETGEHDDDEVTILLQGKPAPNNSLTLPNGIQLTYGEIIAFAGDFYGIPESPICEEVNGTSYKSRFMDAFNTLGRGDVASIRNELIQIRHILMIEKNSVATVLGHGDPSIPTVLEKNKTYNQPSDVYQQHGLWFTIQYDTILGGKWSLGIPLKFGRMMKLAENNPDHFQPYSKKVWETGHLLALQKAEDARMIFRARREEAVLLLNEAYAISAFSCHFLTDSFAAGHIR